MLKGKTTQPGFVNRNSQVVIRNTNLPGTDYGQLVTTASWARWSRALIRATRRSGCGGRSVIRRWRRLI